MILSAYEDVDSSGLRSRPGSTGYLLKTMPRDELVAAVRAAGQGTTVLDPESCHRGWPERTVLRTEQAPRLTWREREIVELVAEGFSNKAIAARLGVSARTVEGHLNHVFTKLGVESRTELVRFVLTHGWISSDTIERPSALRGSGVARGAPVASGVRRQASGAPGHRSCCRYRFVHTPDIRVGRSTPQDRKMRWRS